MIGRLPRPGGVRLTRGLALLALAATLLLLAAPPGEARRRSCGTYLGVRVKTSNVTCATARYVLKRVFDPSAGPPKGWVCAASARMCYRGRFGSRRWISWSGG